MQTNSEIPLSPSGLRRAILAGLCASLVGIGLARFAYTPLIPALIEAHWFSTKDVVFLGAANLLGYLGGALVGRPLASRLGARRALQWMMALASFAFLACSLPLSVTWFFGWRFLSGLSGGIIMVLTALTVLPHVPAERRGVASGAIFLGLGLGIAASGTLVPLLLNLGLAATWVGLGVVALALTLASWHWWPQTWPRAAVASMSASAKSSVRVQAPFLLNLICAQYALTAIGVVPMMVFIVDYIARGLNLGMHTASLFWVIYGIGAILGPMTYGALGDRFGTGDVNRASLALQVAAATAMILCDNRVVLVIATLIIGTFPPGTVPLTLARIRNALPHDASAQTSAWSRATTIFALFQALAGYAYSYLFEKTHQAHKVLIAVGAAALVLALLSDILFARAASKQQTAAMSNADLP